MRPFAFSAGVSYSAEMEAFEVDIPARIAEVGTGPLRDTRPAEVMGALTVRGDWGEFNAAIRSFSPTSFTAEVAPSVSSWRDTYIRIEIAGLGLHYARVVWSDGRKIGAEFVRPIASERLREAIGRE